LPARPRQGGFAGSSEGSRLPSGTRRAESPHVADAGSRPECKMGQLHVSMADPHNGLRGIQVFRGALYQNQSDISTPHRYAAFVAIESRLLSRRTLLGGFYSFQRLLKAVLSKHVCYVHLTFSRFSGEILALGGASWFSSPSVAASPLHGLHLRSDGCATSPLSPSLQEGLGIIGAFTGTVSGLPPQSPARHLSRRQRKGRKRIQT